MANKTDLQNSINTIDDGGLNTASEVRSVYFNMLENTYPDIVRENSSSTGIITAKNTINTSLTYAVSIVKIGRVVYMSGFVENNSGSIVSSFGSDFFFEIINSDYFPEEFGSNIIFPVYNANFVELGGTGRKRFYINNIGSGQTIDFNIFYYAKN